MCVLMCLAVVGCETGNQPETRIFIDKSVCDGPKIAGMCVVSYYNEDGSYYLTEQQHSICSDPAQIKISAQEPVGKFVWRLASGNFSVLEGASNIGKLERTLIDRNIARLLLTSMTSSTGSLGGEKLEPVKLNGKWYQPVNMGPVGTGWGRETIFQEINSSRIDMVELEDIDGGLSLTAHCYNYRLLQEINAVIPTKIDIMAKQTAGGKSRQLARIEYIDVQGY